MCIILYKHADVDCKIKEKEQLLRNCWENNSDGAGFAWYDNKWWQYRKGYMNLDDLLQALWEKQEQLDRTTWFIHFRIATAGLVDAGNTHPQPICDNLETMRTNLKGKTQQLAFHNGVMGKSDDDYSDTQHFIKEMIYPLYQYFIKDEKLRPVVENICIPSRWVLTNKDSIWMFGQWHKVKDHEGLLASNTSYKIYKTYTHKSTSSFSSDWYNYPSADPKYYTKGGYFLWQKFQNENPDFDWGEWASWDRYTKNFQQTKKKKDSTTTANNEITIVDSKGNACIQKQKPALHLLATPLLVDSKGKVVWDEWDEEAIIDCLVCPNCYQFDYIVESPFRGVGDSVCMDCGAVFDDETGYIQTYINKKERNQLKNVER